MMMSMYYMYMYMHACVHPLMQENRRTLSLVSQVYTCVDIWHVLVYVYVCVSMCLQCTNSYRIHTQWISILVNT